MYSKCLKKIKTINSNSNKSATGKIMCGSIGFIALSPNP